MQQYPKTKIYENVMYQKDTGKIIFFKARPTFLSLQKYVKLEVEHSDLFLDRNCFNVEEEKRKKCYTELDNRIDMKEKIPTNSLLRPKTS